MMTTDKIHIHPIVQARLLWSMYITVLGNQSMSIYSSKPADIPSEVMDKHLYALQYLVSGAGRQPITKSMQVLCQWLINCPHLTPVQHDHARHVLKLLHAKTNHDLAIVEDWMM